MLKLRLSCQPPKLRKMALTTLASCCLIGSACQSTPSADETATATEGQLPPECESDEDCAPDEICVEDSSSYCEFSCAARQPDLDVCDCAEGRYCEPGDDCPTIGCAGGQLCANGGCQDVSVAPQCEAPTYWSFNTLEAESGSGVVAIRVTQSGQLAMLRPGSVEVDGVFGGQFSLPGTEDATMIRAGNIDGADGDDLLIAGPQAAWLFQSGRQSDKDPSLTLELATTFAMEGLIHVELGDFGGTPELDVWLQGATNSELHVGNGDFSFAEPLSLEQDWPTTATWAVGDLDLSGHDDLTSGTAVWLGADVPAWMSPSLVLDPPAWLGAAELAVPLAIPDGLAIAWTIDIRTGVWPNEQHALHTVVARYPSLGAPSADAILYPGHPDRMIGPADAVDQGFIAIEGDEIVVYREIDGQQCRAATWGPGNSDYVDAHISPNDTNRMLLLTADGAVEEWLRL